MFANLFERKIQMTKAEAKKAGIPGTEEYETLLDLMKNFPTFPIDIAKSVKKAPKIRLTNEFMENFIKSKNHVENLKTFYELRGLDENGKKKAEKLVGVASFVEVKVWFLAEYPEVEKYDEKVNKIIKDAREKREEQKKAG
jgi:hypothetical protein